ncbi:DUF7344 domain-containing protein [Haladaptatus sp. DFWS20]|uniref:DUF7344 domain-containing protein n=1 Tax=Haladaptatus sp. DFWS20 TaxID=3403467 RepID=UPI003EC051B0
MKTETPNIQVDSTDSTNLPPTTMFDLLANDHRRYTLHYLSQKVGAISLGDLAEQIAIWEDTPTYEEYERILTGLHHQHLPKLVDAGIIHYDMDSESVEILETADHLLAHLELVAPIDIR